MQEDEATEGQRDAGTMSLHLSVMNLEKYNRKTTMEIKGTGHGGKRHSLCSDTELKSPVEYYQSVWGSVEAQHPPSHLPSHLSHIRMSCI